MYFYLFLQEIHLRVLQPSRACAGREDEAVNEVYPKNYFKKTQIIFLLFVRQTQGRVRDPDAQLRLLPPGRVLRDVQEEGGEEGEGDDSKVR